MADLGKLIVVLAGPSAAVDRIVPYCEGVYDHYQPYLVAVNPQVDKSFYSIARAIIDLRDQSPGKATLLKVTGNTVILSMVSTYSSLNVY